MALPRNKGSHMTSQSLHTSKHLSKHISWCLCLPQGKPWIHPIPRRSEWKKLKGGSSKIKIDFAECNMPSVSLTCKPDTSDTQLFFFTQDSRIISNTARLTTPEREVCHMTFIWPTWINMSLKAFVGNNLYEIENIFWKSAHNRSHGIIGLCVIWNIFWDNYRGNLQDCPLFGLQLTR